MILRNEIGGFVPSIITGDEPSFADGLRSSLPTTERDVDLQEFCTQVSNQLWESSCVANASADAIELCNGVDGLNQVQVSRNQIYYNGRSIMTVDGIHNLSKDDHGMTVQAAFQAMSTFGICPEALWPYKPDRVNERPDIKATWYALKNKLKACFRINNLGPDMLDDIRSAIGGKHPVCFGFPVTESFYKCGPGQVVPPPAGSPWLMTEKILGRHCVIAIGKIGDNIKIRNSWGTDWGDSGYTLMHQDWFNKGFAEDPWVPTNGLTLA